MNAKLPNINSKATCPVCEKKIGNSKVERENRYYNNTKLCSKCFEEAGLENDHQDGHHDGEFNDECPMCREAAEAAEAAEVTEDGEWTTIKASEIQPGMTTRKGTVAARRVGPKWATAMDENMFVLFYQPLDADVEIKVN